VGIVGVRMTCFDSGYALSTCAFRIGDLFDYLMVLLPISILLTIFKQLLMSDSLLMYNLISIPELLSYAE
jgi:hypothetical protein